MGDRDSLSERKAFRRQGSGRRNDFADLSVNRSKLLLERSHAFDQCASWARESLRFDSSVMISIN